MIFPPVTHLFGIGWKKGRSQTPIPGVSSRHDFRNRVRITVSGGVLEGDVFVFGKIMGLTEYKVSVCVRVPSFFVQSIKLSFLKE